MGPRAWYSPPSKPSSFRASTWTSVQPQEALFLVKSHKGQVMMEKSGKFFLQSPKNKGHDKVCLCAVVFICSGLLWPPSPPTMWAFCSDSHSGAVLGLQGRGGTLLPVSQWLTAALEAAKGMGCGAEHHSTFADHGRPPPAHTLVVLRQSLFFQSLSDCECIGLIKNGFETFQALMSARKYS